MTYATFIAERPEFDQVSQTIIEATITQAENLVGETAYGDAYETALSLMTAHLLALAPFGEPMRLEIDGQPTSTYLIQLNMIKRQRPVRGLAVY